MIERIHWLGHASFLIEGTPTILIDPWRVVYEGPAPDLILISHEHYDHCSPADVNKLRGRHTQIIASRGAAAVLDCPCTVLRPWQVVNLGRTSIRAVPSYTFSGDHPVQREDIGFVISQNYTDIYYAGDTDFVPELRSLRADVAILPTTSREGQMNAESAAAFVKSARPRYVIPSHIGEGYESARRTEIQNFHRALEGLTQIIRDNAYSLR